MHKPPEPLAYNDSLKFKVVEYGDIQAYRELRDSFMSSEHPYEFLPYAVCMDSVYHDDSAASDAQKCIELFYEKHPQWLQLLREKSMEYQENQQRRGS